MRNTHYAETVLCTIVTILTMHYAHYSKYYHGTMNNSYNTKTIICAILPLLPLYSPQYWQYRHAGKASKGGGGLLKLIPACWMDGCLLDGRLPAGCLQ